MTALLVGLSRRTLIELRRYAFDTIFQFVGIFLLFTLLFWGASGIGGQTSARETPCRRSSSGSSCSCSS